MKTTPTHNRIVINRDGKTTSFDKERIVRSIALALFASHGGDVDDSLSRDRSRRYGVDAKDLVRATEIAQSVDSASELFHMKNKIITAEELQKLTETILAAEGEYGATRACMLYREHKNEMHRAILPDGSLEEYKFISRFGLYDAELKRCETMD